LVGSKQVSNDNQVNYWHTLTILNLKVSCKISIWGQKTTRLVILSTCRHGIASGKISEFLTPSLPLGIRLCPDQSSSGGEVMGLVLTCLPALQAPNTGTSSRADFVEVSAHCSQHPSPISWNPTYSPYLFACPAGCSRLNLSAAINFESWCVCACSGFRGLCAGTDGKAHELNVVKEACSSAFPFRTGINSIAVDFVFVFACRPGFPGWR
jgi:hypothetical protein